MADANLNIIVGLVDKTGGALGKLTGNIQKIGKVALGVAAGGVAAIGAGVVLAARKAIPAASNLNEAVNAVNVVFGESADQILAWGQTADKQAGLAQSTFAQMSAQTGAMLQNLGLDTQEAADSTIALTQRAADMASIFNTDVADALGAIQAGLRGEADPLERFGVSMKAAAVNAKAVEMGLAKSTTEVDNAARAQAALALLFEQTDKIAGDFVNTSGDLANMTRVNQARWENFMAQLGQGALPIVQKLQGWLMELGEIAFPLILGAMENIMPVVDGVVSSFMAFFENLQEGWSITDALLRLVYDIGSAFGLNQQALAEWLLDLEQLWMRFMELIQPIVDWIQKNVELKDVLIALGIAVAAIVIPALIGIVTSALPIIAILAGLVAAVAIVRKAWEENWGDIQGKVQAVLAWFQGTLLPWITGTLYPWLKDRLTEALQILSDFWTNTLQPAIEAVWEWLRGVLIPFLSGTVYPWLKDNLTRALQILSDFWTNTLQPAIQEVWNWMSTVLMPFLQDTVYPWLQENIPAAIQTLSDFWTNTLKPAIEAVWQFIQDYLVPIFEEIQEIMEIGLSLAITALQGAWENVLLPALETIWDFVENKIIPAFTWLKDNVIEPLGSALKDLAQKALTWVYNKLHDLKELLGGLKLPSWLTPGSPTPLELGLRGISDALNTLNSMSLPSFNANLGAAPGSTVPAPVNYNYYLTAQYGYQSQSTLAREIGMLEILHR